MESNLIFIIYLFYFKLINSNNKNIVSDYHIIIFKKIIVIINKKDFLI